MLHVALLLYPFGVLPVFRLISNLAYVAFLLGVKKSVVKQRNNFLVGGFGRWNRRLRFTCPHRVCSCAVTAF